MALKITEDCISCGDCEPECPNTAISVGEDYFIINPSMCTECVGHFDESQCLKACRYDCIIPDAAFPESKAQLQEKYQTLKTA